MVLLSLLSCKTGKKPDLNIVARVGDKYLTKYQVENAVPSYLSGADSVTFVKQYIEDWVYQELVYNEAVKSVSDTNYINGLVEEYRKTLYTTQFEQQLIMRKLDTLVRESEIDEYYFSHLYEFILARPVVKLHAVVLNVQETEYSEVIKLLKRTEYKDIEKLFNFCTKLGMNIMFINEWISMDDFYKLFPCAGNMLLEKPEKHEFYECHDDEYRYLIIIDDLIETGNYAPVEVLYDNIKKIILQKRSKEYLSLYKKQLFIQAENSGRLFIKNKN